MSPRQLTLRRGNQATGGRINRDGAASRQRTKENLCAIRWGTLKRFGPPFALSRNYLRRMIQPAAGPSRREFYYFLEWRDDGPSYYFGIEGTAPKF